MSNLVSMPRIFDAMLRKDFHMFVLWSFRIVFSGSAIKDNWHLRLMAEHLEDVYLGHRRKLMICLPPRHLKSFIASVAYPAWVLGLNPGAKFVCVSYAQNIAEGFAHQCRKLMESADYQRVFPKTRIDPRRSMKREIGTTRGGHRLATSVTGALTALGGDYLIIDDPIKADDALSAVVRESVNNWFFSTATSRLDDPKKGAMVLVAQRLHVDDLPGRMISLGGWDEIILPLVNSERQMFKLRSGNLIERPPGSILHEDHLGEEEIDNLRHTLPTFLFEAQWNQRPVMAGGNIFKLEWLRYFDEALQRHEYETVVQSWDTAVQTSELNDYTVCATFGVRGKEIHLLDIYRARIDHPDQIKMVLRLRKEWKAELVVMEGSHGGMAIKQHYDKQNERPANWITTRLPKVSKVERAEWQTSKIEQGRLYLPRMATWRSSFESELTAFPKAAHDDQVDAVTQFLEVVDSPELANGINTVRRCG